MSRVSTTLSLGALGLAVLGALSSACSVDVDKYHAGATGAAGSGSGGSGGSGGGSTSPFTDLHLTLTGMKPHLQHRFEYRVVNASNLIQFRGYMDPIGLEDVKLFAARAFPNGGEFRLDFYADVNNSGDYDGIGSAATNDHAWRLMIPVDGNVSFAHNFNFTDLDQPAPAKGTGISAKVHLKGLGDFVNQLVEVRVIEKDSGHTVSVYRFPKAKVDMDAIMVDTVDANTDYIVQIFADAVNPLKYDLPAPGGMTDRGWIIPKSTGSGGEGLEIDFDPANPAFGEGFDDVRFEQ